MRFSLFILDAGADNETMRHHASATSEADVLRHVFADLASGARNVHAMAERYATGAADHAPYAAIGDLDYATRVVSQMRAELATRGVASAVAGGLTYVVTDATSATRA